MLKADWYITIFCVVVAITVPLAEIYLDKYYPKKTTEIAGEYE